MDFVEDFQLACPEVNFGTARSAIEMTIRGYISLCIEMTEYSVTVDEALRYKNGQWLAHG